MKRRAGVSPEVLRAIHEYAKTGAAANYILAALRERTDLAGQRLPGLATIRDIAREVAA